ncbi:MAG TPA: DUF2924 domain-containing protein [Gemmataceae bacterium]
MNILNEVTLLQRLSIAQLRQRFAELFGEGTAASNRTWLVKRIAWRLQALAAGDLSERARRRAAELARDADLRLNPPRPKNYPPAQPQALVAATPSAADPRLPPPGTILTRPYKGQLVQVLTNGFAYAGSVYPSLSAVAKAITGTHTNGYHFFRSALCNPRGRNAHLQRPRGELMDDRHSSGGATM